MWFEPLCKSDRLIENLFLLQFTRMYDIMFMFFNFLVLQQTRMTGYRGTGTEGEEQRLEQASPRSIIAADQGNNWDFLPNDGRCERKWENFVKGGGILQTIKTFKKYLIDKKEKQWYNNNGRW